MESVWNNKFLETPPALSWVYKLDMSNYTKSTESIDTDILSQAIVSVSLGKRESEFVSVYYGGVESKVFTRAKTSDSFSIKFNEDSKYTISNIFEQIYAWENMHQDYPKGDDIRYNSNVAPNTFSINGAVTADQSYTDFTDRIIAINVYSSSYLPNDKNDMEGLRARLEFYGCKIASMNDIEFSYESTETITRDITFFYNFMRFLKPLFEQKDVTT